MFSVKNVMLIYSHWVTIVVLLSYFRIIPMSFLFSAIMSFIVSMYLITFGNLKHIHHTKKIFNFLWKSLLLYCALDVSNRIDVFSETFIFLLYLMFLYSQNTNPIDVYNTYVPSLHTDQNETLSQMFSKL